MLEKRENHIFFKVIVSIIIIEFMMLAPNHILAKESTLKKGDINNDGNIDLSDLVVMLRHIAAEKSNKNEQWLFTEEQVEAGDIIQDNKIDSSDVLALLRYMAANKSNDIAKKHKEWLALEKTEEEETEIDNIGPKIEKIEAISKTGDYKTGNEIQIKVTFDEKIYAAKNKVALSNSTIPILNISFGEGKIKHPYVEENSKIENYIIYKYRITEEDKGMLKINGAQAFDGTKTICDEAGNEVTLTAGKDLTGNTITANETSVNNSIIEITLDKKAIELDLSGTKTAKIIATVTPSGTPLVWTSSNSNVATIDGKTGMVTATAEGETDITVKATDGTIAICRVTVKNSVIEATGISLSKTSLNLEENDGERLITTIQPTNATNQEVTWSSSNSSIATVNESGFVTAKKEGTAIITATTTNGKTATCQVTVKKSIVEATGISLSKTSLNLEENDGERLIATIQPTSATNQEVTWSSSNSSIATVSESGFVTARKEGTATVTAKTVNGKKATCQITVKKAIIAVTSINLNQTNITIIKGKTAQITATVKPTNATNQTITWTSSNKKVATVSSKGKIKALKAGTTVITAKTLNSKKITCKVKVNEGVMNIPYISQGDSKYASYRFPVHTGSSIAANACGIVSTTMVLQYLTDTNVRVEDVATWADNNGHFNGIGSNATLFDAAAKKWKVGKAVYTSNLTTVKKALNNGKPVIGYQKAGLFTRGTHFIVLTGIDSNGKIHVNNPNGMNQGKTFTGSQIHSTSLGYWIFDAKS